jgi:hypothetical protein
LIESSKTPSPRCLSVRSFVKPGSDETTSTQIPVCVGLTPPSEGFIPYEDLTYDIVCGWLNEGTDVVSLDAELAVQLDNIINPKTVVLPNPF